MSVRKRATLRESIARGESVANARRVPNQMWYCVLLVDAREQMRHATCAPEIHFRMKQ